MRETRGPERGLSRREPREKRHVGAAAELLEDGVAGSTPTPLRSSHRPAQRIARGQPRGSTPYGTYPPRGTPTRNMRRVQMRSARSAAVSNFKTSTTTGKKAYKRSPREQGQERPPFPAGGAESPTPRRRGGGGRLRGTPAGWKSPTPRHSPPGAAVPATAGRGEEPDQVTLIRRCESRSWWWPEAGLGFGGRRHSGSRNSGRTREEERTVLASPEASFPGGAEAGICHFEEVGGAPPPTPTREGSTTKASPPIHAAHGREEASGRRD